MRSFHFNHQGIDQIESKAIHERSTALSDATEQFVDEQQMTPRFVEVQT